MTGGPAEIVFTTFNSFLRCHPLSLRSVAELLCSNGTPEVLQAGGVFHKSYHPVADTLVTDVGNSSTHTDDRQTVQAVLVRTSQNVEPGAKVHLCVGAPSDAGLYRVAVCGNNFFEVVVF